MRTTFTNAKIFLGTDETSFASAITIEHDRVTWVGDQSEVTDPTAIDLLNILPMLYMALLALLQRLTALPS